VFQHFLNFKAMVEKEKGVSIKVPKVWWRGKVLFKWIEWILEGARNSKEVFM
jgi:hypothetical protein